MESPAVSMGGEVRLTRRQWITLIAIGSVHFSSAICISLQAPFYPQEAEKKGATATEYGLVFGSFELVAFITSPILGKSIEKVGAKRALNIGMVIASISAIMFGMLDLVMDHNWFISLSFLLRMTESVGSTAALVSAFSITAAVFPNAIGTTFASLEVFYGVGYVVGPTIGGFLFTLGGYKLPFIINGLTMLTIALVIVLILPPIHYEGKDIKSEASVLSVLRVPAVMLNSFGVVAVACSMGYYSATLEPHLRMFNLTPLAMGLMFIISGGTYACVAPFVGRICDRWAYPKSVICIGSIFIITSYSIVGPAPFVPLPTTLPLCILGLVIHGFGLAAIMVPTFMDSICSAVAAGFKDDISTYGIISGLWSASFSLGAFIGPSVAGILYDSVGFRNGTLFIIAVHTVLFISCCLFILFEKERSPPPHRVRLLSERIDTDDNNSDYDHIAKISKGSSKQGLISGRSRNDKLTPISYGSITKSIEVL